MIDRSRHPVIGLDACALRQKRIPLKALLISAGLHLLVGMLLQWFSHTNLELHSVGRLRVYLAQAEKLSSPPGQLIKTKVSPPSAIPLPLSENVRKPQDPQKEALSELPESQRQETEEPKATPEDNPDSGEGGKYYPLNMLDKMPAPIDKKAIFLESSSDILYGGEIQFRFWLSAEGTIERVETLSSTIGNEQLAVVLQKFSQQKFLPGEINGIAVACWGEIRTAIQPSISTIRR